MQTDHLLYLIGGLAVLSILTFDIIGTVLHNWLGMGPISGTVVRGAWRVLLWVTERKPQRIRRAVLGWIGPFLAPLMILVWVALGTVGFGMLFMPWMPQAFTSGENVPTSSSLWVASYYSAVTLFTLGYGAVLPTSDMVRALAVLEAAWGFSVVSLVTSYFVALSGAGNEEKALAGTLDSQVQSTPDAARIVALHAAGGNASSLLQEITRIRGAVVRIRINYHNYPNLYYLRAREPNESYVRLLFLLHDLALLLDTAVDPDACPVVAGTGARSGLCFALEEARASFRDAMFRRRPQVVSTYPFTPPWEAERWTARFDSARQLFRTHGIPVREDEQAVRDYCEGRLKWEPELRAIAAAVGADWETMTHGL